MLSMDWKEKLPLNSRTYLSGRSVTLLVCFCFVSRDVMVTNHHAWQRLALVIILKYECL